MAEVETACLVCGKDSSRGVKRAVEASSALYQDLLQDSSLQVARDQFRTLCLLCDRLVSQFEEITRERRAIKEELEARLADNEFFCAGESASTEEETIGVEVVETGEITDVSNFMKEGVKIFEIDVKSDDVVTEIADEIRKENILTGKFETQPETMRKISEDDLKVEFDDENTDEGGNESAAVRLGETESDHVRICRFCLRSFDTASLVRHQSCHDDEPLPYLCLSCDLSFASSSERNFHYLAVHRDNTPQMKCGSCQKVFTSNAKLKNHMKNCLADLDLNCKECGKTFANRRNLRDHTKIFHRNNEESLEPKYSFPCKECDKVFYKKSNLTSHLLRHSSEKPFICGVETCGKGFKREKTLLKHFQLIHEGIKEELLCIHCGAQFRSHSGLRAHVSVHTGQETVRREVKCLECEKAFRCKADLETHMVVHSRAKPYSCDKCSQVFSQKASLKDHENVHLAKYQCKGCSKAFGRERYLKLHKRTCVHLTNSQGDSGVQQYRQGEGEVKHIIISGVGGAGDDGDLVQVVQVPQGVQLVVEGGEQQVSQSRDLAVLHHQGVQLVVEGGEQVVTIVPGPEGEQQSFQIVSQEAEEVS